MIYNSDYDKLKNLGIDNYNNSLSNPKQDKIAILGTNNYTDNDDIYNIEETLCMYTLKINEIIDALNGLPDFDELLNMLKIILNYLKHINLSNYYNKQEIDKLLDDLKKLIPEPCDLSNYYNKQEIDILIQNLKPTVDAFTKAETRAFYLDKEEIILYKYYKNQVITNLGTYRYGDILYYNFKVEKNDDTRFNKYSKYFIAHTPLKIKNTVQVINGVGRGFSIDDYVLPCAVSVDNEGIISVACSDNAKSIIISGSVNIKGLYNEMLLFNPERIAVIPEPKDPIEFREWTPGQIRQDLINNYGYVEEELTSYNSKLKKNNLIVNFTTLSDEYDKYEINNELALIENIDEIKRILGYTFPVDIIDYILSRQEPENYNWIELTNLNNKTVGLEANRQINVHY